jgi:hypothetical protein
MGRYTTSGTATYQDIIDEESNQSARDENPRDENSRVEDSGLAKIVRESSAQQRSSTVYGSNQEGYRPRRPRNERSTKVYKNCGRTKKR